MKRVILGLSGGVDSAVAAELLKRDGYEVIALYLNTGGEDALKDAEATAHHLGVRFEVRDVSALLQSEVCAPFVAAYLRGETPNPCIMCNPRVKFRALYDLAEETGAEHIATGHYARTEGGAILRGHGDNDQSYMLCRLTRAQADKLLLPLGAFAKTEVRAMAEAFAIPVARKRDSMEICFIPDKDYIGYIARHGEIPKGGDIVFEGESIARHEGIHRYTVGQRLPGLYNERRLYVCGLDAARREVRVCLWEDLFKTELDARDMNYLIDEPGQGETLRGSVRVRHTKWEIPECSIERRGTGAHISCDTPVRAPAAGQAAAIYQGDRLIGGGWIEAEKEKRANPAR